MKLKEIFAMIFGAIYFIILVVCILVSTINIIYLCFYGIVKYEIEYFLLAAVVGLPILCMIIMIGQAIDWLREYLKKKLP
jgi:hypothetical protein